MTETEDVALVLIPIAFVWTVLSARWLWVATRRLKSRSFRGRRIAGWVEILLGFLIGLSGLAALVHSLVSDHEFFEKFQAAIRVVPITYSFAALIKLIYTIVVFATFFPFVLYGVDVRKQRERRQRAGKPIDPEFWHILRVLAAAAVLLTFYYLSWQLVKYLTQQNRVVLGVLTVMALSLTLFMLKLKALVAYATVEIIFAFLVCVSTLSLMKDVIEPGQLLSLLTSVYLFIRGLDNMKNGLKKRPNKGSEIKAPETIVTM